VNRKPTSRRPLHLTVALVGLLAIGAAACSEDPNDAVTTTAASTVPGDATTTTEVPLPMGDIVGTALTSHVFTELAGLVVDQGLVEALRAGPYTVFAPTDDAFAKLPKGTVEDLLKPENKAKLVGILTYHVLPSKVMAADIAGKKMGAKTVQGTEIAVDAMSGVKINGATVITADVAASNGVIHIIDAVLLPK